MVRASVFSFVSTLFLAGSASAQSAIEEGRSESVAAYAIRNAGDTAAVRKLAGILAEHGIEVSRATAAFTGCGRSGDFPAGSLIVELAQPAKRLIRTILDADVPLGDDFLEEQERRRKRNLPSEIYDVTGWSLPQLFNLETVTCDVVPTGSFGPAGSERVTPATITGGRARVAYLAPWGTAAAGRLLAGALRADLRVLSSDKTIEQGGRTYPSGTLIFPVDQNPSEMHDTLDELARQTGAEVVATDTGWVEGGVNFGCRNVRHVRRAEVALAWDAPTSSSSAGATRFVLEGQYGYPVTPIRSRRITSPARRCSGDSELGVRRCSPYDGPTTHDARRTSKNLI